MRRRPGRSDRRARGKSRQGLRSRQRLSNHDDVGAARRVDIGASASAAAADTTAGRGGRIWRQRVFRCHP